MAENTKNEMERVRSAFSSRINSHGFGYQYAVVRAIKELYSTNKSLWGFGGAEIPVQHQGQDGHVDFVFFNSVPHSDINLCLVGECKKVDPAKENWCFFQAPFTWPSQERSCVQFDGIGYEKASNDIFATTRSLRTSSSYIATHGFEIKGSKVGDGSSTENRGAINAAIAQVARNSSGYLARCADELLEYFQSPGIPIKDFSQRSVFIPVIFTTARLFVTGADISEANIEDGRLDPTNVQIEEKDWIWYNYNRSKSLSHSYRIDHENYHPMSLDFLHHTRSIAIVGRNGIESFVSKSQSEDFFHYLR